MVIISAIIYYVVKDQSDNVKSGTDGLSSSGEQQALQQEK